MKINYNIEFIYLFSVFVFLLLLSINLTIQLLDIQYTEKKLHFLQSNLDNLHKNESLTYILSNIYAKKYQWINSIQALQKARTYKSLHDNNNTYSLANLNNTIGCIYKQLNKRRAAEHYFKRAKNFNNKNTATINDLNSINEIKLKSSSKIITRDSRI